MPNPTNGNLKYIITTTIAVVMAVGMALAYMANYESVDHRRISIEAVVEDKLDPIEVDLRYIRRDIGEIKAALKDMEKNH